MVFLRFLWAPGTMAMSNDQMQVPVALQSESRLSGAEVPDELHRLRPTFFWASARFWEKYGGFEIWYILCMIYIYIYIYIYT